MAARCGGVLVISHHGGIGPRHPRAGPLEPGRPRLPPPLRLALAAPRRGAPGTRRILRRHRGLGNDRGRPPTVHHLWPASHRGFAFAARGAGGGRLAAGLRGGLLHRVRRGHRLPAEDDGSAAAAAGRRTAARAAACGRNHSGSQRQNGDAMNHIDLSLVWAGIIAFAVFAYVLMDGFDLGIGILFPTFAVGEERDQAMNSIAPVWDGNETWLVLGGGGLFAAFPLAYAIILPATYPLMIAMLLGLVFRGVAFEFRWRDPKHRIYWDAAFTMGSLTAAIAQGITLGAILQGIRVANSAYAGGWLDWLSPFTLLTGASLVLGYALLGASWLIWKTEGAAQAHARRMAFVLGIATLIAMGAVSAATPFLLHHEYWRRWFSLPGVFLTAQ